AGSPDASDMYRSRLAVRSAQAKVPALASRDAVTQIQDVHQLGYGVFDFAGTHLIDDAVLDVAFEFDAAHAIECAAACSDLLDHLNAICVVFDHRNDRVEMPAHGLQTI
ncbi:MAG TPA: hypothetical protein VIG47_09210, partial [Gemmatimonadaceae bacterium]